MDEEYSNHDSPIAEMMRDAGIPPEIVIADGVHEDYLEIIVFDSDGELVRDWEGDMVTAFMPWPVRDPLRSAIIEQHRQWTLGQQYGG